MAWAVENKLAIAQLVEHLTVDIADIRWSLVRFRVARLCMLVASMSKFQKAMSTEQKHATPKEFEPLRAEPNGFLVHLLSHSDTVSYYVGGCGHHLLLDLPGHVAAKRY